MPRRSKDKDPLPYLDPAHNPSHPYNQTPPPRPLDDFEQVAGQSLSKLADKQWENDWYEQQMAVWTPPHVLRSWETDTERARRRAIILSMVLHPKERPVIDDPEEHRVDFRMFAKRNLKVAYERIHVSEETVETPDDLCWILEYSEPECNLSRRKIAKMLGEFPAVIDPENAMYDEYMVELYKRRLYCRCTKKNKLCIRPSHVEIFTSQLLLLP